MELSLLSLIVGLLLGLLGGGGSILAVPALVYGAGLEAKPAIATSLLIVGVTSAFGLLPYAKNELVHFRIGLVFGLVAMVGAFAGGWAARFVSETVLLVSFGWLMSATAAAMLLGRRSASDETEEPRIRALSLPAVALEGLLVGGITGLVGAGGGFLVVPALVLLGGLPMRLAVGTSLLVIALKSFAGLLGHLSHVSVDWGLAAPAIATAALGVWLGARLSQHVPQTWLRQGFGVFVLLMSMTMLAVELPLPWPQRALLLGGVPLTTATVAVLVRRRRRQAELDVTQPMGTPGVFAERSHACRPAASGSTPKRAA